MSCIITIRFIILGIHNINISSFELFTDFELFAYCISWLHGIIENNRVLDIVDFKKALDSVYRTSLWLIERMTHVRMLTLPTLNYHGVQLNLSVI